MAEGVSGCHLHLHMLRRTTGTTHRPTPALRPMFSVSYQKHLKIQTCVSGLIRAGDVRTAADQVLMSMLVFFSLLDMETTHYAER